MKKHVYLILSLTILLCVFYVGCGDDGSYNVPVNPTSTPVSTNTPVTATPVHTVTPLPTGTAVTGTLTVNVTAKGNPVTDAVVTIAGLSAADEVIQSLDSVSGNTYTFTGLVTGNYRLTVVYEEYKDYISDIVISEGTNTEDVSMPMYWQKQDCGISAEGALSSVCFVNSTTGWAVGSDSAGSLILYTSDGGTTWTRQTVPGLANYVLYEVDFVDSQSGWAVGYGGSTPLIVHTSDGGTTWTRQTSGVPEATWLNGVDFVDSMHGWAVGIGPHAGPTYASLILYTDNGGLTWNVQSNGVPEGGLEGVCFLDIYEGWATGTSFTSGSGILHTINGGTTWTYQIIGNSSDTLGLDFVNYNTGFVLGQGTAVSLFHTADGGNTWEPMSTGKSVTMAYGIDFVDEATGWVTGQSSSGDPGIRHTSDGGLTWTSQQHEIDFGQIIGVNFVDSTTGWAVGIDYSTNTPIILKYNP